MNRKLFSDLLKGIDKSNLIIMEVVTFCSCNWPKSIWLLFYEKNKGFIFLGVLRMFIHLLLLPLVFFIPLLLPVFGEKIYIRIVILDLRVGKSYKRRKGGGIDVFIIITCHGLLLLYIYVCIYVHTSTIHMFKKK